MQVRVAYGRKVERTCMARPAGRIAFRNSSERTFTFYCRRERCLTESVCSVSRKSEGKYGMRTHWIVVSVIALADGIGLVSSASAQEYRGTWEQQAACTSDVWRLCSHRVPEVGRIVACLRQNTDSLSDACRAVFKS